MENQNVNVPSVNESETDTEIIRLFKKLTPEEKTNFLQSVLNQLTGDKSSETEQ